MRVMIGDENLTIQNLVDSYDEYVEKINDVAKSDIQRERALKGLDQLTTQYLSKIEDFTGTVELSNDALETQKNDIKEMWISILPGIDGWNDLSDAQQAFVEKYVRGLDIDLTNANSMESQEQEIKNRVRKIQEIFDGESVELKVTLPGANEKAWLLTDIIETLGCIWRMQMSSLNRCIARLDFQDYLK